MAKEGVILFDGDGLQPSNEARSQGLTFVPPTPASPSNTKDSPMQSNGFAKLPRWLEDYDMFGKDAELCRIVTVLSFAAQFSPGKIVLFHGKPRVLQIGQVAIGRKKLAERSKCNEDVTYKRIEWLKKAERIVVETDRQWSIITCVWFLNGDDESGTNGVKERNERSQTATQSQRKSTPYSEEEERVRGESKIQRENLSPLNPPKGGKRARGNPTRPPFNSYDERLRNGVRWFVKKVLDVYPSARLVEEKDLAEQAYHLKKIFEHYDESYAEFTRAVQFAEWSHKESEFDAKVFDWMIQTRSIHALRKVKPGDTISRMEYLLEQAKSYDWTPIP